MLFGFEFYKVRVLFQCECMCTILQLIEIMINKYTTNHQNCPSCHSALLELIGTQPYCLQCHRFTSNLAEEVKVVPDQYQSNCRNKRELQKARRYNQLIREFSDKYWTIESKEQLDLFRWRLTRIKELTVGRRGSREAAAVVIFYHLKEQIKMTIKEYCKDNNLNVKLFHQKYKVYTRITENHHVKVEVPEVKKEEDIGKLEESPTEKQSAFYFDQEQESQSINEQDSMTSVERAKHALQLIYDRIFNKFLYRQKKTMIMKGLLSKFQEINKQTLGKINYHNNSALKTYYLIFAIIKSLGYRINFIEYSSVVYDQTKFNLKRKPAGQIKRIYQNDVGGIALEERELIKTEENSEPTSRSSSWLSLPRPMVAEVKPRGKRGQKKEDKRQRVDLSDSELINDCQ